jgi:hypothetical protein
LAVIIVAQLLQGMRMQMAIEAGVDALEISLPLVLQVLPDLLREQQEPMEWIQRYGRELGMIHASSRLEPVVPKIVESDLMMPTEELPKQRQTVPQYTDSSPQYQRTKSEHLLHVHNVIIYLPLPLNHIHLFTTTS